MIKLELTPDDAQCLIQALDTHIRQHGLQVATASVAVLKKIKAAASVNRTDEPNDPPGKEPK